MKQSVAEDVPSHLRRTGRIESLAEFQQRVRIQSSVSIEDPQVENLTDSVQIARDTIADSNVYLRRQSTVSSFGPVTPHPIHKSNLRYRQYKILFFLFILGIIGVPVIYFMKRLDAIILSRRMRYIDQLRDGGSEYFAWIVHALFFTIVGLLLTQISSAAAGSGVSQMKTILTGIDPSFYLPGYFDASTLIAKMGGLVCAVGAGLVVGTEGANVHIMSIITHHLLRLGIFENLGERLNMRLQFLAAACAVGVAATFSSPIGGVLFSMEVTSTYYLISNYLKAFISSVSGALVLKVLLTLTFADAKEANSSILMTSFPPQPYTIQEIPLYMLLGLCIGVIATGMLWLVRVIAIKRTEFRQMKSVKMQFFIRWVDPMLVAVLCASATYLPGKFTQIGRMSEIVILFTPTELPESWRLISKYYACTIVCAIYVILLPLCITLKLPTGIWLPTFIAGAAFGRCFGEFVKSVFPTRGVIPGTYALAGAAAFGGASTKTISVAVITLEITGAMQLMLPIFCSVLVSIGVVRVLGELSVYDTLLFISKLPYLPTLRIDSSKAVGDVMEPLAVYVTRITTISKLLLVVQRMPGQDVPVLRDEETRMLLGVVSTSQLRLFIHKYYSEHELPDVEVDLGEAPTLIAGHPSGSFGFNFTRNIAGGLNGTLSYDQLHNALTTKTAPAGDLYRLPFILDDHRMLNLLTRDWTANKKQLLDRKVKLNHHNGCFIKPLAVTISSTTPLDDLHMIFTMFRCDHCFVCDQGALVGVVTTKALLQAGNGTKHME